MEMDKSLYKRKVIDNIVTSIRRRCFKDGWVQSSSNTRLHRGTDFIDIMPYYDENCDLQLEVFYLGRAYEVLKPKDRKSLAIAMRHI